MKKSDLPEADYVIAKNLIHFLSPAEVGQFVSGALEVGDRLFASVPIFFDIKTENDLKSLKVVLFSQKLGFLRGTLFIIG